MTGVWCASPPGRPTLVQPRPVPTVEPAEPGETVDVVGPEGSVASPKAQRPLDLEVRRLGVTVARLRTNADPADVNVLHKLLTGAVRRDGAQDDASDEYELVVRYTGNAGVVTTYVAAAP